MPSGSVLKEEFATLSSANALLLPLFPGGDKVSPMDYASARAAHESGEFVLSSQWGETDEP
jgi:hypothetical protein